MTFDQSKKYALVEITGETEEGVHTETTHHNISQQELAACVISLAEDLCENYMDLQNLLIGIEEMVKRKLIINGTNISYENS